MTVTDERRPDQEPLPADETSPAEEAGAHHPRPGLLDPATVVGERAFTSPKGRRYRIIETRQTDPDDDPAAGREPPR